MSEQSDDDECKQWVEELIALVEKRRVELNISSLWPPEEPRLFESALLERCYKTSSGDLGTPTVVISGGSGEGVITVADAMPVPAPEEDEKRRMERFFFDR